MYWWCKTTWEFISKPWRNDVVDWRSKSIFQTVAVEGSAAGFGSQKLEDLSAALRIPNQTQALRLREEAVGSAPNKAKFPGGNCFQNLDSHLHNESLLAPEAKDCCQATG